MVREYQYTIPKSEVLDQCRSILTNLDYEIDIYAPESNMLMTKPIKLRRALRRFDYAIYVKITDRIEIHIVAERSIFKRSSESSVGGKGLFEKQSEEAMPISLQRKIFIPIHNGMGKYNFRVQQIIQ